MWTATMRHSVPRLCVAASIVSVCCHRVMQTIGLMSGRQSVLLEKGAVGTVDVVAKSSPHRGMGVYEDNGQRTEQGVLGVQTEHVEPSALRADC